MQVTRIASNYNQQNKNKISFNGPAEKAIFEKALKTSALKKLLNEPIDTRQVDNVSAFFSRTFQKLKKEFGKKFEITSFKADKNGVETFVFKTNEKEKIYIDFSKNPEQLALVYMERTTFIPGVYKIESTQYDYTHPLSNPLPSFKTFFKTKIVDLHELGKEQNKKGTIDHYKTWAQQMLNTEGKLSEFKMVDIGVERRLDQKFTPCPIKRTKLK